MTERRSMELEMRVVELETQLSAVRITASRAINTLEQVKIFLEEGDDEGALALLHEVLS